MNNISINITDMNLAISKIETLGNKLILIAGASASGKSYFAKQLTQEMEAQGKKVLLISSDNYYSNESALKYVLYGTFDHPHLIDYPQLKQDIQTYLTTGSMRQPVYSFVEKRTIEHKQISQEADYIIVEGIYTINELNHDEHFPSTKIFVDSSQEELIFRRLIRDQKRVAEPMHMIIENLGKVFPMRNIYGYDQKNNADIIIFNNYEILDHQGMKCAHTATTEIPDDAGELQIEKQIINFHYSDTDPDNGDIIISEVYYGDNHLLRYVQISKVKKNNDGEQQTIDIRLYQPGILTSIHTLLQTAGLPFVKQTQSIERVYQQGETKRAFIKENGNVIEKCLVK